MIPPFRVASYGAFFLRLFLRLFLLNSLQEMRPSKSFLRQKLIWLHWIWLCHPRRNGGIGGTSFQGCNHSHFYRFSRYSGEHSKALLWIGLQWISRETAYHIETSCAKRRTFLMDELAQLFSDAAKDAFLEISNIGIGRAAATMSDLVGRRVNIAVPRVELSSCWWVLSF